MHLMSMALLHRMNMVINYYLYCLDVDAAFGCIVAVAVRYSRDMIDICDDLMIVVGIVVGVVVVAAFVVSSMVVVHFVVSLVSHVYH